MPVTASTIMLPNAEVALVGIDVPLGGLSIGAAESVQVVILITATLGTLSAATFPGATISGDGSHALWIAGSAADVNAKLATLVYNGPVVGQDTVTVRLIDTSGMGSGLAVLPVTVLPLTPPPEPPAPPLAIIGGTLILDTRQLDGVTLDIDDAATGAGAATLVLVNSTLGPNTAVNIASSNPASAAPRLAVAGQVNLAGATSFAAGSALVTLAQNALLINAGAITLLAGSTAQFTGSGTLQNDGSITAASASNAALTVAVTGSGVISIQDGATLTLAGPVSASETVSFAGNSGVLDLGAPQSMHATIVGFQPGDLITLGELPIDSAAYTQAATGGTLTLFDAGQVSAVLTIAGTHQLSDFLASVATDSASDGGAITTLSVLAAAADTSVYRFFDTTTGTQLLTQSLSERDLLAATRPDLKFEGVAMGAVAAPAADPAATAVYRFFDTADGTHFFTADAAEKAALIATRRDLVFEPNSTIWEDAAPQPGDTPVYRFFDTVTGSHFYTASATERASILSTRPDLAAEGIAFYAPTP